MSEQTWTAEETKAHRKLWTDALRSGKYQQGRTWLYGRDGRMCCLGVACELSGLGKWTTTSSAKAYDVLGDEANGTNECMPPRAVAAYFGLLTIDGTHNKTSLDSLNDGGTTFAEIADIIEAEPEGLIAK